jgi:hypothetical protein
MFGIALKNRAFKAQKSILEKASFLSFSQNVFWPLFRVKKSKILL